VANPTQHLAPAPENVHSEWAIPFCFDYIVVGKNKFRRQSRHEPIVAMSVLYLLVICSPSRFTGSVRLPVS